MTGTAYNPGMNDVPPADSGTTARTKKGSQPPLTRAEQGERSRAAILEAALSLFAQRGYYGTSLHDITIESGGNRSLIIYYFKNKMGLWRSAVDAAVLGFDNTLAANLARVPSTGTPNPARQNVTAWLDTFLEQPRLAQIMVLEGGQPGERLDWLIERFKHSAVSFASPALREQLTTTILRAALMGIFLTMSALGPLMEASLAKANGQSACGIFPLSPERRDELINLILIVLYTFEAKASLQ